MEGEEEENETEGFTLLCYMNRMGRNQFSWENKPDILKTLNQDILLKTEPPVPVSSRYHGYPNNILKKVEALYRVSRFTVVYFKFNFFLNLASFFNFLAVGIFL